MNKICQELADGLKGHGSNISSEKIEEIGMALIRAYSSIDLAAERLGMSPARLRWLITEVPELQVYHEIAHAGVKGLTDRRIIEGLRNGDEEIVKAVFSKMYSGRAKGGYNPAELGTMGYQDPISKQIAAETEVDRKKSQVVVEFNFIEKDIRTKFEAITIEDEYTDGELIEETGNESS